jgi:hypothetical protein
MVTWLINKCDAALADSSWIRYQNFDCDLICAWALATLVTIVITFYLTVRSEEVMGTGAPIANEYA